jgi:hypothetical protein
LVSNRECLLPDALRLVREQADCISRCVSSSLSSSLAPSFSLRKMAKDITNEKGIMELICKIKCNAFGIWNSRSKCIAMALFPRASMFNHSCLWYFSLSLSLYVFVWFCLIFLPSFLSHFDSSHFLFFQQLL